MIKSMMKREEKAITIRDALARGAQDLAVISESALLDVQLLLADAMQISRTQLLALVYDDLLNEGIRLRFEESLRKRITGYPVAYLLGYKEFYGRRFLVDERVLIPRPDTEILVESLLTYVNEHEVNTIREVGFGSGAIALTLACELVGKRIIASDISEDAYEVFRQNYQLLHNEIESEVESFVGNLWDDGRDADILVSNLPYLTYEETMERKEALWQEPSLALNGELSQGDGGLGLIYQLIKQAQNRVKAIFLEASSEQMPQISQALEESQFYNIKVEKDLAGEERLIWALSQ